MKNSFGRFILEYPKSILLVALSVVLLLGYGTSHLTTDFSYRVWFRPEDPNIKIFDSFERKFGGDEIGIIFVHSPSGIFDDESITLVKELTKDLWLAPEVIRVESLTNYNYVYAQEDDVFIEPFIQKNSPFQSEYLKNRKQIALKDRVISDYLVNKITDTAVIYITLKPSFEGSPSFGLVVKGIEKILKNYEGRADHSFHIAGSIPLMHAFKDAADKDMFRLVPIVLIITVLFLWMFLRSIKGFILPSLTIVFVVLSTMGTAGWFGVRLNNITGVVPQILIAITLTVSVHILVSFFQYLRRGYNKEEALNLMIQKNMSPTLLTSISTAIGFFSFSTSSIPPISQLGVFSGIGAIFAWLLSFLILIPIIKLIPINDKDNKIKSNDSLSASALSVKFVSQLIRFKYFIVSLFVLLTVIFVFFASKVKVNTDPNKYFSDDYPLAIATKFGEEKLGAVTLLEMFFESSEEDGIKDPEFLKKVEALNNWILKKEYVTKTNSILDILKELNKVLNNDDEAFYKIAKSKEIIAQQLFLFTMSLPQGRDINDRISVKNDSIRLTAMLSIHDSITVLSLAEEIKLKMKELGLKGHVTGKFPLYASLDEYVVKSFVTSMGLAILFISLLMVFWLKSIKLGLLSLVPNTVPLLIGAGLIEVLGRDLNIGTMIIGSICFGVAVDDTIHFLSSYNKYKGEGDSTQSAIAKIMTFTAPSLVTTTVVLVASFAVFGWAQFIPNKEFGIFSSLILTIALVLDLTFLPTLLLIKDKDK